MEPVRVYPEKGKDPRGAYASGDEGRGRCVWEAWERKASRQRVKGGRFVEERGWSGNGGADGGGEG